MTAFLAIVSSRDQAEDQQSEPSAFFAGLLLAALVALPIILASILYKNRNELESAAVSLKFNTMYQNKLVAADQVNAEKLKANVERSLRTMEVPADA